MVHDQATSYLCHSFATISAFRQSILTLANDLHVEYQSNFGASTYQSIIEGINNRPEYSFDKMLTVFLGCVSPRSFLSTSDQQGGDTKKVVYRLGNKTAFECEGWKRIIPARRIFQDMHLDIDDFELVIEQVNHPNSHTILSVLEEADVLGKGNSWFQNTTNTFQVILEFVYLLGGLFLTFISIAQYRCEYSNSRQQHGTRSIDLQD